MCVRACVCVSSLFFSFLWCSSLVLCVYASEVRAATAMNCTATLRIACVLGYNQIDEKLAV